MLTNATPNATTSAHPVQAPVPMLRWIFRRGTRAVTCEVSAAMGRYEVCVVPHWDVSASVIESFDAPVTALERHATIARQLREEGWSVDHVPLRSARPEPARAA